MDFRANDPGSSQFGNFINYYQFHPPENRVNLFPDHVWDQKIATDSPFIVLDVGCNSGNLTLSIYKYLKERMKKEIKILAIDIDPALVKRAADSNEFPENIQYQTLDVMNDNTELIQEFLNTHNHRRFNAVFCLSTTMWIHLNHGDDGLKRFIDKLADWSELLVIEPQPWKCYQTALKRMRKGGDDFPLFKSLQIRQTIETEVRHFVERKLFVELFKSVPTTWERTIYFFQYNTNGDTIS